MEDYPTDDSYTFLSAEMPKEFELPIESHSECNNYLTNESNSLPNHSELTNQRRKGLNTSRGLTICLNQVETSEASYRTKAAGGRVKLTDAQRKENKRLSDLKYKESLKRKAAEQAEEIVSLKRQIGELQQPPTCHEQLPTEVPQKRGQDTCIAPSTSKLLDRPSVSVQNCDSELSHNLKNLHQIGEICTITLVSLLEKIDADEESSVKLSDFTGLDEHREQFGKYSFPLNLISTVKRIIDIYGDISVACKINLSAAETIYILFCASIKEMDEIQFEQLNDNRILKWRDAIKDALRINFKAEFAMEHLKKIVQIYIGRKESQEIKNITQTISSLEADLNAKKEELAKKKELSKKYINDAEEFDGKSLSLFT